MLWNCSKDTEILKIITIRFCNRQKSFFTSKQIPLCAVLFIMKKRKIEHGKGNPRMSLHLNRAPLRKITQRFTEDHTPWKKWLRTLNTPIRFWDGWGKPDVTITSVHWGLQRNKGSSGNPLNTSATELNRTFGYFWPKHLCLFGGCAEFSDPEFSFCFCLCVLFCLSRCGFSL